MGEFSFPRLIVGSPPEDRRNGVKECSSKGCSGPSTGMLESSNRKSHHSFEEIHARVLRWTLTMRSPNQRMAFTLIMVSCVSELYYKRAPKRHTLCRAIT